MAKPRQLRGSEDPCVSQVPEDSVISWAWHRHAVYRERYAAAAVDPAYAHLRFVRLRDRGEVRRFLAGARPPGDAADRGTRRA